MLSWLGIWSYRRESPGLFPAPGLNFEARTGMRLAPNRFNWRGTGSPQARTNCGLQAWVKAMRVQSSGKGGYTSWIMTSPSDRMRYGAFPLKTVRKYGGTNIRWQ